MKTKYKYYYRSGTDKLKDGIGWYDRIYKVNSNNRIVAYYSLDKQDGMWYRKWYKKWRGEKSLDKMILNVGVLLSDEELFLKML